MPRRARWEASDMIALPSTRQLPPTVSRAGSTYGKRSTVRRGTDGLEAAAAAAAMAVPELSRATGAGVAPAASVDPGRCRVSTNTSEKRIARLTPPAAPQD